MPEFYFLTSWKIYYKFSLLLKSVVNKSCSVSFQLDENKMPIFWQDRIEKLQE